MVKKMLEVPSTVCPMGLYRPNRLLRLLYLIRVAHEAHLTELGLFIWPGWRKGIGDIFTSRTVNLTYRESPIKRFIGICKQDIYFHSNLMVVM